MDPIIQNWRAELDVRRGQVPSLQVSGDVISDQPVLATLTIAPKQGTMAQDLFLVLKFKAQRKEKITTDKKTHACFNIPANQGQFTQVTIFYENSILQRLEVAEVG